ncbi:GFA family protein [Thalassotalea fonticola]|uniref:GFA family protein n=1 Tax=Thalassotalea fonticola TaxID=3065649 RepID=A0ABZ0GLG3_9GAMM|nr:GFA family protein [Colwelliaceae bacterium S1-1]
MNVTGQCQCGAIHYQIKGELLATLMCYCTECHKVSAGYGTMTVLIDQHDFHLTKGALKVWQRSSDSGNINRAYFCGDCGNRIYHQNPNKPDIIRLKTGTLANSANYTPKAHLWLKSAPDWVLIPKNTLTFQTQPLLADLLALIKER